MIEVLLTSAGLGEPLEDAGGAHASPDAHGDHAVAGVFPLQIADQRGGELGSGAAKRVAEGDRATVGIYARGVEGGLLDYGERLRGESFIEFDYGDIAERETGELQRFGDGEDGADAELLGRATSSGIGDKTRERLEPESVGAGLAHDHGGGGTIAHRGTVSGGDGAFGVEGGF